MKRIAKSVAIVVLVLGLGGGTMAWGAGPEGAKININTADAQALETLPGIGPAKAEAVVEYRQQVGSFESVNDLTKVPGIGDKTVEQLKDRATVSSK